MRGQAYPVICTAEWKNYNSSYHAMLIHNKCPGDHCLGNMSGIGSSFFESNAIVNC